MCGLLPTVKCPTVTSSELRRTVVPGRDGEFSCGKNALTPVSASSPPRNAIALTTAPSASTGILMRTSVGAKGLGVLAWSVDEPSASSYNDWSVVTTGRKILQRGLMMKHFWAVDSWPVSASTVSPVHHHHILSRQSGHSIRQTAIIATRRPSQRFLVQQP